MKLLALISKLYIFLKHLIVQAAQSSSTAGNRSSPLICKALFTPSIHFTVVIVSNASYKSKLVK